MTDTMETLFQRYARRGDIPRHKPTRVTLLVSDRVVDCAVMVAARAVYIACPPYERTRYWRPMRIRCDVETDAPRNDRNIPAPIEWPLKEGRAVWEATDWFAAFEQPSALTVDTRPIMKKYVPDSEQV